VSGRDVRWLPDVTRASKAEEVLLKAGACEGDLKASQTSSRIAMRRKASFQIFKVGAERMLGYTPPEVMNKIHAGRYSESTGVIARAKSAARRSRKL